MKHILLTLILLFSTSYAYAGQSSAVLNMRVSIIQCGERALIAEACKKEEACCAFLPTDTPEDFQLASNIDSNANTYPQSGISIGGRFYPRGNANME